MYPQSANPETPQAEDTRQSEKAPSARKEELPAAEGAKATPVITEDKPKSGLLGGIFDKVSVDDLILFGLLLAMLLNNSSDNVAILAVVLAMLLT